MNYRLLLLLTFVNLQPIGAMEDHSHHMMPTDQPEIGEGKEMMNHESHAEDPLSLGSHPATEEETMDLEAGLMSSHGMHHGDLKGMATPSAQAYVHANHMMHMGMAIEFTGDADVDFLRGMIPHHQGAVDMAKIQLEHGQDGLLKSLTSQIIREQNIEINFMTRRLAVLESRLEPKGGFSPSTLAYKLGNKAMHHDMDVTYTGNADIDFVNGMIPHHQGAVDMAKIVLKYGEDPNVRNLAHGIINAQETEITWMKRWLSRLRLMGLL